LLTLRGPSGFRRGTALSDLGLIEGGAVLIRDGLIENVGTSRRIENLREARDAIEISAHGLVVLPFVDQGLSVFLGDYRMKSLVQAREEAAQLLRNCLEHGSVSTEIEAGGTDSLEGDVRLIRQGSKIADNSAVSLAWRISTDHRLSLCVVRGAVQRLISREWVRSLSLSGSIGGRSEFRNLQLGTSAPAHVLRISGQVGSPSDLDSFPDSFRSASIALGVNPTQVLEELSDRGIPALCRPLVDFQHHDLQPLQMRDFVQRGGIPVLATAHHRLENPGFSMQAAIALAVRDHGMTTEQAITAATNNAACSLGWGRDRGTIEVGKRADLLVMNVDDFREIPRQFGTNHCRYGHTTGCSSV
jgi:imidazolonepropionase